MNWTWTTLAIVISLSTLPCGNRYMALAQEPSNDGRVESPSISQKTLLPIYDGTTKLWGYRTADGTSAIPPAFDEAGYFREGVAVITEEGVQSIIDEAGERMSQVIADDVWSFSDGLAAASQKDRWGYIDTQARWVIQPQFSECYEFRDGLAFVKSTRRSDRQRPWGVIDIHGNWTVPPQFSDVTGAFQEDRSAVCIDSDAAVWVLIDSTGHQVSDRVFKKPPGRFDSGLALVQLDNGESRFITRDGQDSDLDTTRFVEVLDFSEGLAPACADQELRPLWGFIDKQGKWVIAPKWLDVRGFREGHAVVRAGPMWGVIDRRGMEVIPAAYSHIASFGFHIKGFAIATREDGMIGYLSVKGSFVADGRGAVFGTEGLLVDLHFGKTYDELLTILKDHEVEESTLKPGDRPIAMISPHATLPREKSKHDVLQVHATSGDRFEYYWLIKDQADTWRVFSSMSAKNGIRF